MAEETGIAIDIDSKLQRAGWAKQVKETVVKKMQALVDKEPEKCAKAIRTLIMGTDGRG